MVQSISQCSNLFLALPDFSVKLISISLQLFLLLGRLNNIVSLGMLSYGFYLTR
jgi:hypothetical protein